MQNVNYCKTNISIFLLTSIDSRTIFTAGVEKLRYTSTTSGSGRRSHRPIVNKSPFYQFFAFPIHKLKTLQHQINKYVKE